MNVYRQLCNKETASVRLQLISFTCCQLHMAVTLESRKAQSYYPLKQLYSFPFCTLHSRHNLSARARV